MTYFLTPKANSRQSIICNQIADLVSIDNFLTKETVVLGISVEETPVHLNIPDVRVAGARKCRNYPQVEENILLNHLITMVTCHKQ